MDSRQLNGTTLAYVGDAIYSLQVREHLVRLGLTKSNVLQKRTIPYVGAYGQARYLKLLIDQEMLSNEEMEYVKRGRNAKTNSVAKNADIITYRNATGLEALWGFLYLEEREARLSELMAFIFKEGEKNG